MPRKITDLKKAIINILINPKNEFKIDPDIARIVVNGLKTEDFDRMVRYSITFPQTIAALISRAIKKANAQTNLKLRKPKSIKQIVRRQFLIEFNNMIRQKTRRMEKPPAKKPFKLGDITGKPSTSIIPRLPKMPAAEFWRRVGQLPQISPKKSRGAPGGRKRGKGR